MHRPNSNIRNLSVSFVKIFYFPTHIEKENGMYVTIDSSRLLPGAIRKRDEEWRRWHLIWGVDAVQLTLGTYPAFAMPFVITAADADNFATTASDLAALLIGQAPHPDDVTALEPLANQLSGAVSQAGWTPRGALNTATQAMAVEGYAHMDLEWRHVGLLPHFADDGTITSLRPILIDLEVVSKDNPELAAKVNARFRTMMEAPPSSNPSKEPV
jgi:hypothetical protein